LKRQLDRLASVQTASVRRTRYRRDRQWRIDLEAGRYVQESGEIRIITAGITLGADASGVGTYALENDR